MEEKLKRAYVLIEECIKYNKLTGGPNGGVLVIKQDGNEEWWEEVSKAEAARDIVNRNQFDILEEAVEKAKLEWLVREGLQSGIIKVEIEDLDMNELKVSIGDNWFWTYVDYIDAETLLEGISKEEINSKITLALFSIREDLAEEEFLYYTYYLEENLSRKDNCSLDEKMKFYSKEATLLNDSNEIIKNDYSYEVRE